MLKKVVSTIAISIIACGCSTTSIKYKTPIVSKNNLSTKQVEELNYICKMDNSVFSGPAQNEFTKQMNEFASIQFDKTFIKTLEQSDSFKTINKVMSGKDGVDNLLEVDVKHDRDANVLNALACVLTLGIIPNYAEDEYTVTCQYTSNGKKYRYSFKETTTEWLGLFIIGEDPGQDRKEAMEEVYRNIADNLLLQLSKDKAL